MYFSVHTGACTFCPFPARIRKGQIMNLFVDFYVYNGLRCDGEYFEVQCMVSRTPDDEYDFLTLNHYEEKISYNDDGNTQQKKFLLCFIEYSRQCICFS